MKSLKFWFTFHFIIDFIVAFLLIFYPMILVDFLGVSYEPVTTKLVAAALLGIGGISLISKNYSKETHKALLELKLIWSFFATVLVFCYAKSLMNFKLMLVPLVFGLFFVLWFYYWLKIRK